MPDFKLVKGTKEYFPPESAALYSLEKTARRIFKIFAYQEARFPILEDSRVFSRGLGKETEIVEKQIYRLYPLEKNICLRPEGTAQAAKNVISHNIYRQKEIMKWFYIGPMFRGERPQKGRLREFSHIGAEFIGAGSYWADAELIKIASLILSESGIKDYSIEINSLGCVKDKQALKNILKEKLSSKKNLLCPNCRQRLQGNTLRILDCKNPGCREIVSSLKINHSYLCTSCRQHFDSLCRALEQLKTPYTINPVLVRGLDYYTQTVFEIKSSKLGAQDAVGAGGRYNNLIQELGGPQIPAAGFALGMERMLMLMPVKKISPAAKVFVAYTSKNVYNYAFEILTLLRQHSISSDIDFLGKSLKAQLKYSQKLGARITVLIGDDEIKQGKIIVKFMKESLQKQINEDELLDTVNNYLEKYA